MTSPFSVTGSLSPTCVFAQLMGLAIKHVYAFILYLALSLNVLTLRQQISFHLIQTSRDRARSAHATDTIDHPNRDQ
jgi:hypothetical protein